MNRRLAAAVAIIVVAAVGLAIYLMTRPQPTDEERLYRLVVQAQEAAQKHNAAGLTRLLSDSYKDSEGYDKHQLTGLIIGWLRGAPPFTVVPTITGYKVQGDTAQMQLQVRYWTGDPSTAPADEFKVQLNLRREGRDFKVVSAGGWSAEQNRLMNEE